MDTPDGISQATTEPSEVECGNEDRIRAILRQYRSQSDVAGLVESGGVVIETDDDEAKELQQRLRAADAAVEIEHSVVFEGC